MNGLFVTGTDTSVGKTAVVAALLAWLRWRGVDAVPMKPVQTGWPESDDAAWALQVAGVKLPADEMTWVNPYRFRMSASPHLASREGGMPIDIPSIEDAYHRLRGRHSFVIVEGAGGLMVPITDDVEMADLAERLMLPVLIVARPGLGTLNHTQLTARELKRRGLPVVGVVLSEAVPGKWRSVEEDNLETLARLLNLPVRRLPHLTLGCTGALNGHVQSLEDVFGGLPIAGKA